MINSSRFALLFIAWLAPHILRAQQIRPSSEILSENQVTSIFNDSIKKAFKIDFPIFRVYKYVDRSGQYLCVLTETIDSTFINDEHQNDTLHHSIRAVALKVDAGRYSKVWELSDFVLRQNPKEHSIWFWTRFFSFEDFDNDGIVEPVIVYGSRTGDDLDGPRVKIMVYYGGQKVAIRHKDSDLDAGRSTVFDKSYSSLPKKIQVAIDARMKLMDKMGVCVF